MKDIKQHFKKLLEKIKEVPPWQIIALIILIWIILFNTVVPYVSDLMNPPEEVSYNQFIHMIDNNLVDEVQLTLGSPTLIFSDINETIYEAPNPKSQDFKLMLLEKDVLVTEMTPSFLSNMMGIILQYSVFAVIIIVVTRMLMNQTSEIQSEPEIPNITFKDIAGNEEAKRDLQHRAQSLLNAENYKKTGATLPKGILLTGPPGTGKTLMAKALAGESKIPFISISGSDFMEVYVGVGAKRIRKLFNKARENSPCIIFIDEIDAIGGRRTGHSSDGEREQTLMALLVEMNKSDNILVIAATNRVDMLDAALTRPGRFDTKIVMNNPTKDDRIKILSKHLENKKCSDTINLESLAKQTSGFSGAEIGGLVNEAALTCAQNQREVLEDTDFEEAFIKMITSGYRKLTPPDERTLMLTAWHEAGHALCTTLLTSDEVVEISIIPTTSGIGGYVRSHSDQEIYKSKFDFINNIKILYAGRAAEEILMQSPDYVTRGASSDIKYATQLIKDNLTIYGMGESGLIDVTQFINTDELILKEAIGIAKQLYDETLTLLRVNEYKLRHIAETLLEKETLNNEAYVTLIQTLDKEIQTEDSLS